MRHWSLPRSRGSALARRVVEERPQLCAGDVQPAASPIRCPSSRHRASAYRRFAPSTAPSPVQSASLPTGQTPPKARRAIVRQSRGRDGAIYTPPIHQGQQRAPKQTHCPWPPHGPETQRAFAPSSHLAEPDASARAPYCHCAVSGFHQTACSLPYPNSFRA